jgi:putative aminopeptidase FrvX
MRALEDAVSYIETLCRIPSPTGFTAQAEKYLMDTLKGMGYAPVHTPKGTVVCDLGGQGEPLLLAAHVDTLGLMVRSIKSTGRLRYTLIGGYNDNAIENETVLIHTREGKVYSGTVQSTKASMHVFGDTTEVKRSNETLEIVVDELANSEQAVRDLGIAPGDYISLDPRTIVTESGYIKSRHLDDKASSGILLSLARMVKEKEVTLKRHVHLMFTVYEEVGHGASAYLPRELKDMIAVDMGCVGDDLNCDETMVSICAKDSAGPYNYELTGELIELAKEKGLKYAVDIYPRYSSDTATALRAGLEARHALIGTGVFASHGYERTHKQGVENTLKLLAAYVAKK